MPELAEFNQSLALDLYESSEQFPVDFDDAVLWLGYSRRDNAKRHFLKCGFVENVDYQLLTSEELRPQGGFSHYENIMMTTECFKIWGMMCGTDKGREIRLYFLNCERIAKTAIVENRKMQRLIDDLKEQIKNLLPFTSGTKILEGEPMLPISEILALHRIDLPRNAVHRLNIAIAKRVRSAGYSIQIGRSRFSGARCNFYPAYHPLVVNSIREFCKKF